MKKSKSRLPLTVFVLVEITIILFSLKICSVVSWSWWVVTSPLWGPVAFIMAIWAGAKLALMVIRESFKDSGTPTQQARKTFQQRLDEMRDAQTRARNQQALDRHFEKDDFI